MPDAAIISLFLDRYRADKDGGGIRSLEAYQAIFPGYEDLIAREFTTLERLASSAETPSRPGPQWVGPFRIIRLLGRGGQGEVYLAEDSRLRRQVALKVLRGLGAFADEVLARFRREAELTSRLEHPGICPIHEAGIADGVAYIAMRYVRGETLAQRIAEMKAQLGASRAQMAHGSDAPRDGSPGTQASRLHLAGILDAVHVAEKAARILHVTHGAGIVHRDVKPGNIMVTESGDPVILDFGLARDESGDHPTLTRTGDVFGTPAYMSPEQLAGQRVPIDCRTDVYSLGVSLFESLTLQRPFEAPTREALYQAIMTRDAPDLRTLNPAIPANLAVVVATAIEKERDRRYQTALDFAEELRRVRVNEPIVAKPVSRLLKLRRWAHRNPGLAAALAGLFAVLAIGLAVAVFLLAQRDRALSDYDRLGDYSRLQRLEAEAASLWPCEPDRAPAMRAWLEQAADLERRLDGHRRVLDRLRDPADSGGPFASSSEQFKHDTTEKLVSNLTAFVSSEPEGLLPNVRRRLAFAESVRDESIGKHEARWAEAVRSIADEDACPKYRGLRIAPQLGLVPIARDPASGLWEFAHLQTTAPGADPLPARGPDGRLVVTEATGIVFVLLPGGTFRMGAIRPDASRAAAETNLDPEADDRESPVTAVTLDPFFMSKYEVTQGQWLRLVGSNPSSYAPGSPFGGTFPDLRQAHVDLRNPVEQVSWDDCALWLRRLGMTIPTEAQWEYAARGGTATPRWMGIGPDGIPAAANLADACCRKNGGPPGWPYEAWDDGSAVHAPVGSYAANPFGLHDVLGNVWEWCHDWLARYDAAPRSGDGLRDPPAPGFRVYRGGSFSVGASQARSAVRYGLAPAFRHINLGIRPARRLDR
jgi:formylglycine-generating enzyme required for sulfatase activity/serine/threonine protein kinase